MEMVVSLVCNLGHNAQYIIHDDGAFGGIRPCSYTGCGGFVVFKQIDLDKTKP